MEVMPKRIILPRYEYGSTGVLQYYQAQLNYITQYSDLQPKVFQSLREVGNAIIFCLNLTQSLVRHIIWAFSQNLQSFACGSDMVYQFGNNTRKSSIEGPTWSDRVETFSALPEYNAQAVCLIKRSVKSLH